MFASFLVCASFAIGPAAAEFSRTQIWVKERRIDLLVDWATTRNAKSVDVTIKPFLQINQSLRKGVESLIPASGLGIHFFSYSDYELLARRNGFDKYIGPALSIDAPPSHRALMICQKCKIAPLRRSGWACIVRDRLQDGVQLIHGLSLTTWDYSFLAANASLPDTAFCDINRCLIICDGDVEFPAQGGLNPHMTSSVIIVNGAVSSKAKPSLGQTYVWATDGINFPKGVSLNGSIMASGGIINLGPQAKPEQTIREKQNRELLGFRFFQIEDVGVSAALRPGGVTLTAIQPTSALRKAGMRSGDVVLTVDGFDMKSLGDFRRRLRQSYVAESGVYGVRRNNETFTFTVSFKGVSLP